MSTDSVEWTRIPYTRVIEPSGVVCIMYEQPNNPEDPPTLKLGSPKI